MNFVWQALVMILSGFLFLRISGRRSIAQSTIATTIVMISIGTVIVQPIIDTSIFKTIVTIIIFTGALIIVEYLQMKFDLLEKLFTGKALPIIENGTLNIKNFRKIRLTMDKLEMQMRQKGISSLSDIKNATIEPNGQLGYELNQDAKPLTVGDFKRLMGSSILKQNQLSDTEDELFKDINNKHHS